MKYVLFIAFIQTLHSCRPNHPSYLKDVSTTNPSITLQINTKLYQHINSGDTIVFKKAIRKSLEKMAWYEPQWRVDTVKIKKDTCFNLNKYPNDTLICYTVGVVK